jgi:hypothetical protein
MVPGHLEDIVKDVKSNMKEGDKEEEVDITKIPPKVLKDIMDGGCKRKAEADSLNCRNCEARVSLVKLLMSLGTWKEIEGRSLWRTVSGVWNKSRATMNGQSVCRLVLRLY